MRVTEPQLRAVLLAQAIERIDTGRTLVSQTEWDDATRSAVAAARQRGVQRVGAGNALAQQTGETMQEMVGAIGKVNTIVSAISNASREQAEGVIQVGEAITQMDQVTQQNAALVEESAAAADSLQHQARALAEVVRVFKLAGDGQLQIAH